jgi:RNA polymerase sigma factor (sigma-70 family)
MAGQASLLMRAGIADQPGQGGEAMLVHPYVAGQLAHEHSRQMRADASQRQLRSQQGRREARKANAGAVSSTRSVTALVTSARNGDKQAWDELFERYAPLIWSICRRYRLSQMDADDVGQNVWLQLVGQLATTTRRECCRALHRTRQQQAPDHWPDDAAIADTMTETVESELLRAERSAALREALTQLPPDSRRLIALLIQDPPVPYAEISVKLGIPVGSIGPYRARCLQKLRRHPAIVALINAEAQTA